MDDARLAALEQLAGVMAGKSGRDERVRYSDFARQDAEFHDRILEFAGNDLIRETLRLQHTHFHIFRLMYPLARDGRSARRTRGASWTPSGARSPEAAREAMRVHIINSRARLLPAFE